MEAQIQVRRSTAAQWTSANPILASGEPGLETDTRKGKYGDGATRWISLGYSWQSLTTGPTGPAGGSLTGTYPNPTIASGAIGGTQIADGTVGSAELATGAVTTTKVGDLQVTGIKLADAAVVNAKLGPNAVTTDKIQDGTIALADLAAATVSGLMLDVADEGATIATDATKINFVGAGVTAAAASGVATVTITGAPASSIVAGVIAQWSNTTVPSGWYACDGTVKADMAGTLGTRYGVSPGTLPLITPVPIDTATTLNTDVITSIAGAGYTVNTVNARLISGIVYLNIQITRNSATVVLANPGHPDQAAFLLNSPWIPDVTIGGAIWNSLRIFSISSATGQVSLTAGLANLASEASNIDKDDVFILYASYPIAANTLPKTYWIIKNTS